MIEILPKTGTDGALFNHGQRRRQRTRAQQDGEIVRLLHGEIAGNLPGPAKDRFADDRRRDHLVVENDGERLADILLRGFGKFTRTTRVESEADDRLAIALVEAGLGVGEIGAGDQYALLDQIFLPALAVENFRVRRRMGRDRLLRGHRLIDHAKIKLRGLAENFLQPRRVLQAGHLDENAVSALALNGRLDQPEFIDAALDDLDRLIDRLADALGQRRVRGRQRNQAAVLGDIDAALPGGADYARQWLRQLAQLADRIVNVAFAA